MGLKRFASLVGELKRTLAALTDKRTGENTHYTIETIGLSAFSMCFTQSPSLRDMLDPVEPQAIYPVYDRVYDTLRQQGILDTFRAVLHTEL